MSFGIIKNAKDARTIIEAEEPQVANKFVKLFVEKLVIKDHVGTIHFTVPPLGEGPYRAPVSFGIGEYLLAQPTGKGQGGGVALFSAPPNPPGATWCRRRWGARREGVAGRRPQPLGTLAG